MFTYDEFLILKYCFNNIDRDFFASKIAKEMGLNQKTVSNYLNLYLKNGILNYKFEGRNKIFFFNLNNLDLIYNLNLQVEIEKTNLFLKENYKIKELLGKLNLKNYLIFGSYTNKTNTKDSDLDIFLIGNYDEKKVKKLSLFYNIDINIKSILKKDFKKLLKSKQILLNEIVLNHIIVDGYELFLKNIFFNYYDLKDEWKKN